MIFFLTYKRSLAQSANSQQPTANSQQPTANSQQPTANSQQPNFNQNNILFYVNKFINEESGLGIRSVFSLHSVAALFLCLFGASTGLCSMFTEVNIPFYDLACRHSENCVENKSIAMSCGEYVLRTNEVFSLEKNKRMRYYVCVANSPLLTDRKAKGDPETSSG